MNIQKSAECVTPMHPDKICDRISDAILDECLRQDPNSRVAIEVMGGHGIISITGELTTNGFVDFNKVARSIVGDKYGITANVVSQSPEIASGVDTGGAGDQGVVCGYACDDNEAMIPQELYLARNLKDYLYDKFPYDGKTQITLDADKKITVIVASFQNVKQYDLIQGIDQWLQLNKFPCAPGYVVWANPAGDWNIGGFEADTGVTGRKLMVDNYGPQIPVGGGCFSGKDATKVDRSAAYMARRIAVDILRANKAKEVFVKIAYAIGVAQPVMVTATMTQEQQNGMIVTTNDGWDFSSYDLTPKGIISFLKLKEPIYEATARLGHFGRGFEWDK